MTSPRLALIALAAIVVAVLVPGAAVVADTGEGTTPVATEQGLITAGGLHTCAVLDSGAVRCWGANDTGQLGNGTTAASSVPTNVLGITTALSVSAGSTHTCSVLEDRTVRCWGNNGNGQLGNGSTSPPDAPVLSPVAVVGLADVASIAAGGFHTCALRTDTTVACWGHNGSGQLGDGSGLGTQYAPVAVLHDDDADDTTPLVPLTGVTAVAAGEYHTCAIRGPSGEVLCWGHNGFGQIGDGTTGTDRPTPVLVDGLPDDDGHAHDPHEALAIAAGEGHTCVVLDDNTARCWGHNYYGQLGDDTTFAEPPDQEGTDQPTPVTVVHDVDPDPVAEDVQALPGLVSITAGQFHTCAALASGAARCWGNNGRGQLGDHPEPQRNQATAVAVSGLADARAVTAGGFHTCALVVGDDVTCWGNNVHGQLGAYRDRSPIPVTVTALSGATDVTTGDGHACARLSTPALTDQPVCWGHNTHGELGGDLAPSPDDSTVPVRVADLEHAALVTAGNEHTCALPSGSTTPVCWGRNDDGELGDGTSTARDHPAAVAGLSGVSQLSAGGALAGAERGHTCARLTDGGARCWGANGAGQLGDGTGTDRHAPVVVLSDHDDDHLDVPPPSHTDPVAITGVASVSAGGRHACAVVPGGKVRCWGSNAHGQLGDGTTGDRPYAVTVDRDPDEPDDDETVAGYRNLDPLDGVVAVAAGGRHTCAIRTDDTVWCWGLNTSGQLGDGTTGSSDVPVQADVEPADWEVLDITAGDDHTCVRVRSRGDRNTSALCWGANGAGQLGNDAAPSNSPQPVEPVELGEPGGSITDLELVTSISAGRDSTCATLVDLTVSCWGDNSHGQLGDGVGQSSRVPLPLVGDSSVGGNAIPSPNDDDVSMSPPPTGPLVIPVLANDVDADGDSLTVVAVGAPGRGIAATDGSTVTYEPDATFCTDDPTSNTDSFDYEITDGTATVPATITVTVLCPNTPPVAGDVTVTVDEDTASTIDVLAEADDANGDALVVQSGSLSAPAHGTAVLAPGGTGVVYTPDADHSGPDAFTFAVTDGTDVSNTATVHLTVAAINDPPVAVDDLATTGEDTSVIVDVVTNDTDIDGDTLAIATVTDPPHGAAQAVSSTEIRYTPDAGYCGADGFTYTVSDSALGDTGSVVVDVACVDGGPRAEDDAATTAEDVAVVIDVLANDVDPEGDPLTIESVTQPANGTATTDGATVTYEPSPDFCGPDRFSYVISDGTSTDAASVVPVVVRCNNDAPVAADDAAVVAEDGAVLIDVRANDSDVDGDALVIAGTTAPAHGAIITTSSNRIQYTPDRDRCGPDTFGYTIRDPDGLTDDATVAVSVTCVNDAPVAVDPADATTPWGSTLTVPLEATDADVGQAAAFSLVSGPPGAAVHEPEPGSFVLRWTPTSDQIRSFGVIVRVTDAGGASDETSFAVTATKRDTHLTYAGPVTGQYSDPVVLRAILTDMDGAPVDGVPITLAVGAGSSSAVTNAGGDDPGAGAGTVVLSSAPGATTTSATFAGDARYTAAATTAPFEITPEDVTLSFSGTYLTSGTGEPATTGLRATVEEPDDGSHGSLAGVTVEFREVGGVGDVLCTATVPGPAARSATASCTTAALPPGSRAVLVTVAGGPYVGPGDVGAFTIADLNRGNAAGAGRLDAAGSLDDFAFDAVRAVRKSPATGGIVHVYRLGGSAVVVRAATLESMAVSCTGGKEKTCTVSLTATADERLSVDLATGAVTSLGGTPTISIAATDGGVGAADGYRAEIGPPDGHVIGETTPLSRGEVRIA